MGSVCKLNTVAMLLTEEYKQHTGRGVRPLLMVAATCDAVQRCKGAQLFTTSDKDDCACAWHLSFPSQ
jgi:hypothetical protein